jgi:iron-sulfur cluster assembly protein
MGAADRCGCVAADGRCEARIGVTMMTITLTRDAAHEFRKMAVDHGLSIDTGMRLSVRASGCAGLTYVVDFAEDTRAGDVSCVSESVTIVCDAKSALYLDGVTVSFIDGRVQRGFRFANPNARSVCACGLSFGV